MKVIFGRNRTPGSLLLQLYMRCKYSHVGILIDSNTVLEAVEGSGVVLTSIEKFKARYKDTEIRKIYTNRTQQAYCLSQLNKNYDLRGLLGIFVSRRSLNNKNKWFCSELAAKYSGLFDDEWLAHVDVKTLLMISHKVT